MNTQTLLLFSHHWDDVANEVATRMGWQEDTDWNEHTYVAIEPIGCSSGMIDSVMVFADGTIEFHEAADGYAYNWAEYPAETIAAVLLNTYLSLHNN